MSDEVIDMGETPVMGDLLSRLDALPKDDNGFRNCLCGQLMPPVGWIAHRDMHVRNGSLERNLSPTPKKSSAKKPVKVTPNIDDALLAVLAHAGVDRVPLSMMSEVTAWMDASKKLITSLK